MNHSLLLTESQAAAEMGIQRETLRRMRMRGEIGFVRIGRLVRYERESIQTFLRENREDIRPKRLFAPAEVVRILQLKSEDALRTLRRQKKIGFVRLGHRTVRYRLTDINAAIQENICRPRQKSAGGTVGRDA